MPCGDRYVRLMCLLADLTVKLYEDPAEFEKHIGKLVNYEKTKHGYWLHGQVKTYVTSRADPYANLTLLGFAIFGPYWPLLPDAEEAFKQIKEWHRRKIKEAR